jgi:lipopolysaccharide/colanic/teichoic acid biosynthesis glycosyltransferase
MKSYRQINNITGFCLAVTLLFFYAPLIGFIAIAISIDSNGPVLVRRTLKVEGQPDMKGFVFRIGRRSGGRRPTLLGALLRNSGLDRLPLLLSSLWGGMPLGSRATRLTPTARLSKSACDGTGLINKS